MTTTVRTSRNDDLFFIGLGAAAGVAVVFAGLAFWQVAAAPALTGLLTGAAAPGTTMLSQEAQAMGLPLVEGTKAFWYVARAGGILAYMLLWLATLWGVFISSKMVKGWVDGTLLYDMHEELLDAAHRLVAACTCEHGCPACVGPVLEDQLVQLETKRLTLALLRELTG